MSRFNITYFSPKSIWYPALELGFTQLARTNPGWSYSINLSQQTDSLPDLYVLDLTTTKDVYIDSFPVINPRMLLLVHAAQKKMIGQILAECRCSILCVDEHYFNFRDIVESCMRNKRFLSPFIKESMTQQPVEKIDVCLTESEIKVLDFIRSGKSGVEIAEAMFRSQKTVSSHKRNIMKKFGVRDDLGLKRKIMAMDESEG